MPDITDRIRLAKTPRYDWLVRLSALLAVMGLASISVAFLSDGRSAVPEPPMPASGHSSTPSKVAAASAAQSKAVAIKPLAASAPTRVEISAIRLDSPVIATGLDKSGSPTPPDGDNVDKAAWLKTSVTPGETGAAIIVGHATTIKSGPSVFFNLGKLQTGQTVKVSRQDGTSATFSIEDVKAYSKSDFPSQAVYSKTDYPSLRLITCGDWNPASHSYLDNIVVYARLVSAKS